MNATTSPLIADLVETMTFVQNNLVYRTENGKWMLWMNNTVVQIDDAGLAARLDELDAAIALVRFPIFGTELTQVQVDDGRY